MRSIATPMLAAYVLAGLATIAPEATAAQLRLGPEPYPYTVVNQDTATILREFGANLQLKVEVSPEVKGRFTAQIGTLPPLEFLDRVTRLANLDWYFDGSVLHVTTVREARTAFLVLDPVPFERFVDSLKTFGVYDERFSLRRDGNANVALVSGPPRYVTLLEQTLAALVAGDRGTPPPTPVGTAPPVAVTAANRPAPVPSRLVIFRGSQTQILVDGRP